jgi:hypothetical protein
MRCQQRSHTCTCMVKPLPSRIRTLRARHGFVTGHQSSRSFLIVPAWQSDKSLDTCSFFTAGSFWKLAQKLSESSENTPLVVAMGATITWPRLRRLARALSSRALHKCLSLDVLATANQGLRTKITHPLLLCPRLTSWWRQVDKKILRACYIRVLFGTASHRLARKWAILRGKGLCDQGDS